MFEKDDSIAQIETRAEQALVQAILTTLAVIGEAERLLLEFKYAAFDADEPEARVRAYTAAHAAARAVRAARAVAWASAPCEDDSQGALYNEFVRLLADGLKVRVKNFERLAADAEKIWQKFDGET